MTRYLQNWIQSILISKSDFLGQDLHHHDNIVSVVYGNRPFNPSNELVKPSEDGCPPQSTFLYCL